MKIGESSNQGFPLDFQPLLTSQFSAVDGRQGQQSAPTLQEDAIPDRRQQKRELRR